MMQVAAWVETRVSRGVGVEDSAWVRGKGVDAWVWQPGRRLIGERGKRVGSSCAITASGSSGVSGD